MRCRCLLIIAVLLGMSTYGYARHSSPSAEFSTTYTNGINESGWSAGTSVFECSLKHQVPYYGTAVFRTRAGETSVFYLNALSSRFQAGTAKIRAKEPIWKGKDLLTLADVPIKKGTRPMWLPRKNAERMLKELNNGMEIEIIRDAWYE